MMTSIIDILRNLISLQKAIFFLFIIYSQSGFSLGNDLKKEGSGELVTAINKISLPEYPTAHNPSLIDTDQGLLLTFRLMPDSLRPWISYIGVVFLDESLKPISKPQLLDTRIGNRLVPSQSEDARIFNYQGRLYLIYNDNDSFTNPTQWHRRDMYIAEMSYIQDQFVLSSPLKLFHQQKYFGTRWQKNWVPFEWHDALLLSYSIIPHEVLFTDLTSGECLPLINTPFADPSWEWNWGHLRGGTPAILIDDEYLAFFHSSIVTTSTASNDIAMHHYYMGAYTFSDEPPFAITKITSSPIIADGFYTKSNLDKRVIFPGGYVVRKQCLYVAYGKDDVEMWIATISKENLKDVLIPVSSIQN